MSEETKLIHCGKKSRWPKALAELSAFISDAMKQAGYGAEESQSITAIAVKAMSTMAGGRQFYLPRGKELERAARNIQIFNEFNGRNASDLAEKYELTQVQIYSILRSQREAAKQARGATPQQ